MKGYESVMARLGRHLVPGALAVAVLLAGGVTEASAHSELTDSSPAPGEVLEVAPDAVVLTFAVEVTDESTFTVEDRSGAEVGRGELDLDVVERNVLRGGVEITDPGEYTVRWSATDARDGDETTGEYTFAVGSQASASPAPNTAVGRDPTSFTEAFTLGGGLLLATSALLAVAAPPRSRRQRL